MDKSLPFIGVVLPSGQIESYNEQEAEDNGWHHSHLFSDKGLEAFDNDSTLRFLRYNSDDIVTLEGAPSLDPFESGWNLISKLCQHLIEKGMSSNIPVEIMQQNMGTEFEGKIIGTLSDFTMRRSSKINSRLKKIAIQYEKYDNRKILKPMYLKRELLDKKRTITNFNSTIK